MRRTAFWAPMVLMLIAVVAAPVAAKPRQQSTSSQAGCERQATQCLEGCANIDTTKPAGQASYNQCVPKCNTQRNNCVLFSTRK